MNISLTENQFLITIGMSEAEIQSFSYEDKKLFIDVRGIDLLYDCFHFKIYQPDISYDEWLQIKYNVNDGGRFKHIHVDDTIQFTIDNPSICYKGKQEVFLDLFNRFDFNYFNNQKYRYVLGGAFKHGSHDEFELHSNSPIIISIKDNVINSKLS